MEDCSQSTIVKPHSILGHVHCKFIYPRGTAVYILTNVDSRHDVIAACTPHVKFVPPSRAHQNVLDLYLTRPPPNAPHKAVKPEKIVIAGDSAGAGVCVALLTVLRDLDMAQPAGAVLISPWIDLTHSFPSVMSNTTSVSWA